MKILFIACYSPLINNSASIETLQYLNNLIREGNEVDLLTVDFPKNSIYYDEYILNMLDKRVTVHKISGGKIFEKIMPKKQKVDNNVAEVNSNKRSCLRKIKSIIAIPDMYLNWARKASKYGIEIMNNKDIDVIFSMHEPPSSHICAMNIKKKFKNVPWITYWSDPWLKDSTRENFGNIRKGIEGKFEKEIINLADKFIFVTKENRDDYIKSYKIPKDKTYILTRGYDKKTYDYIKSKEKPVEIKEEKINIVYAGEIFSKLRDVKPFIRAIENIKNSDNELFNKLNILFFGNIDDNSIKEKLMAIENVQVSGRIPYDEALQYIVHSDILLLFGNKNSKQIPAKIYDYFGTYGLIFVILGDENDPIKNLVNDKKKCIVVQNTDRNIESGIIKSINSYRDNDIIKPLEEYEWQNISKELNEILKG